MTGLPTSITLVIIFLTAFLVFSTALKYAVADEFVRTRLMMTTLFIFIIATLTISFWHYAWQTLPFTIPAALLGLGAGYVIGVRTEEQKLRVEGLRRYAEHFAHIRRDDVAALNWWTVVNFYSVMGGLILINFVGLASVIFRGSQSWAIASSVVGAFLLGTIAPYLIHLWRISAAEIATSNTSDI